MEYTRWTSLQNSNPNPNLASLPHNQMFHHPQHSSYLSHQPTFSFPRPVLSSALPSEPALHPPPPGTAYANSASYALTHVGFEAQPQYYQDPNAGSQNWIVPVPSSSLTSQWTSNWTNQSLANDATKQIPNQPIWCEVCGLYCNTKDIFEKHVLGKKHQKNLQTGNTSMSSQMGSITSQMVHMPVVEDLARKKLKLVNGGAALDSVKVCTICHVACNSQEVFNKHLTGKKHAAQAGLVALNPFVAAVRSQYDHTQRKKPVKTKVVQSAWCEVCKINCNSTDVYAKHISGKKHAKNLEKLDKSRIDASNALPTTTTALIGPAENPASEKSKTIDKPENLESKLRKVVESGAEAGAVRMCTICNVVCNSQTVLDSHLLGQKHASMLKKQMEAGR